MRRIISNTVAALAGLAALCMAVAPAGARPLHHHHRYHWVPAAPAYVYNSDQPPLTVNKRSWLDPGPVVPQGSEQSYVTETTGFNATPDVAYFPSRFAEDNLPRPLYPTGRPQPVVEFWTPAYPYP